MAGRVVDTRRGPAASEPRGGGVHLAALALAAASLLVAVLAGASPAAAVIVQLGSGKKVSYQPLRARSQARPFEAFFSNLDYNGGPVMPSNTNYVIYWQPAGAPAYPPDYQPGVNRYFEDLAHDSGGVQSVESVAAQY